MRELPAIAKAAGVPNAVKSFGTTWQQSGQPQFRRLWLARFTRTYPTQLSNERMQRALGSTRFRRSFLITCRDIHPTPLCGSEKHRPELKNADIPT